MDVLDWFQKYRPNGYQTAMHSVLKNYVVQQNAQQLRTVGRAQEIFKHFYAQCFWHYDPDLQINQNNIELVIGGLRKYGGREGFLLAEELCH